MSREDIIVMCEDALDDLEYNGAENTFAWNTLLEVRAYLVNQGD
jgi:hypothetical protein